MANPEDNDSSTTKCSFCSQGFTNVQNCLSHELLAHLLQNRNKRVSHVQKKINTTRKYLNSPEKLEERILLRDNLKTTKKGEELKIIFELVCIKTDHLGLIFTRIQTCLEKLFQPPGTVKIYPFGSIASGLALRDCDIDIYLDATDLKLSPTQKRYKQNEDHQSHQRTAFNYISKLLFRSPSFTKVCPISKARVPIIRCQHTSTGFNIDINISFPSSRENTQFIYDLVRSDRRIHELMLFLKLWTKNMQIIGKANMTSYCLVTMVIFFLQQPRTNDGERILKSIKELQEYCPAHIVQGVNYAYNLSCKENTPKIPSDVDTWHLITEFFSFYKQFNFEDIVISPFYGKAIEKINFTPEKCDEYYKQLKTTTEYGQGDEAKHLQIDRCMCVQDAFCLNQNTAKNVMPPNKEYFVLCLEKANKICKNAKNLELAELYEQLLFDTLNTSLDEAAETDKTQEDMKKLHLSIDETKATHNDEKLTYTIAPSKADIRILLAHTEDTKDTETALRKWCQHYVEAIELMMSQLYRIDMQKLLSAQQKQLKLDEVSEGNDLNRIWLLSCTVDLWTNRQFQKHTQTSFIAYQLEQSERLYNIRRQDPNYSVTINVILKLNVLSNYKGIEIQVELPEVELPLSSLHKKSPTRKFFNMFKNTLQNYNLKEALQCKASSWIKGSTTKDIKKI